MQFLYRFKTANIKILFADSKLAFTFLTGH